MACLVETAGNTPGLVSYNTAHDILKGALLTSGALSPHTLNTGVFNCRHEQAL